MIVAEAPLSHPKVTDTPRTNHFTLSDLPCPVCHGKARGSAVFDCDKNKLKVYSVVCDVCGFKWCFTMGNLIECAEDYIRKHPIESCFRAL